MKKISPLQIAVIFTGSFLGAGFLSGQEILQFFGQFGPWGLAGMALAVGAFCWFSLMVLRIAKITGRREFDRIIIRRDNKFLRGFFSAVFLFFLFGVMVGMIAGAGALLQQLLGIPALAGDAVMTVLALIVAVTGAAGMLASFSVVVPLLVAAAVVINLWALCVLPVQPAPALLFSSGNPLLGNWFFSAVSFISYNMMAAVTILVPLTEGMENRRAIHRGMALGAALLTAIFASILLPLLLFPGVMADAELPMLALAHTLFPALGVVYAVLLFCGMFTATLSSLFGITSRLQARLGGPVSWKFIALLCALAFAGSIFGFKNMVSYVYPICGYVGFFALIGIVLHDLWLRRHTPKGDAPN